MVLRPLVKATLSAASRMDRLIGPRQSKGALAPVPDKVQNIIIWSMDRLGDLVRATPAIHGIRERFPDAHITLVAAGRAAAVLLENPYIDEHIQVDNAHRIGDHVKALRLLRTRDWDLGFLLEVDAYWAQAGAWCFRGLGVRRWVSFDFGFGALHGGTAVHITNEGSWLDQYNLLAAAVGAKPNRRAEVFVSAGERASATEFLNDRGIAPEGPFFVLHPGGNFLTVSRQWPPERFASLATLLWRKWKYPILVTGTGAESPVAEIVRSRSEAQVLNVCGEMDLRLLTAVLDHSTVCIMNDTGPTHIAHALGRKVVVILGPTAPEVVGIPANSRVARVDLPCSPCAFLTGWQACTNELRWECLTAVSPEFVLSCVEAQMPAASPV